MTVAALADFGSTFTKVSLVELGTGQLVARGQSPTTASGDVMRGYQAALAQALSKARTPVSIGPRLAASSAAGGLRVAAVGLVEDLTAAAARQAALNAGARIELVLHGRLTEPDRTRLERVNPDVVLLSGGTDGGQERIVLANARVVGAAAIDSHFVVACNQRVAEAVARILARDGARVDTVANVLPSVGRLEIEPARVAITGAFVKHVIRGKGLSASREFARAVVTPTPEAVLRATQLLAFGHDDVPGVGDLAVIDVGGATTDVHSAVRSSELSPGIRGPLLPLAPVFRTVQGDLGLRENAPIVLATDREWLSAELATLGLDAAAAQAAVRRRALRPSMVAATRIDLGVDEALAVSCVHHAIRRHCGRLTITTTPHLPAQISANGADLRKIPLVIGTGGLFARVRTGGALVRAALERCDDRSLTPRRPKLAVDSEHVLAAGGLLAEVDRQGALALIRNAIGVGQRDVA